MSEEKKKIIVSISAPGTVTYFSCDVIAEETLGADGSVASVRGAIPDGKVFQFPSVLKTIKNYKNGVLDGDIYTIDLSSGKTALTESYEEGTLKSITQTFPPDTRALTDPALKTDTSRKGIYFIKDKDVITYYNNAQQIAKETLGPKEETMSFEGFVPDGPVKEYYDNNLVKAEFTFLANRRTGPAKRYDAKGRIISEENYQKNIRQGEAVYYDYFKDEKIVERSAFKNNLLEGKRTVYFKNGLVNILENYTAGRREGKREVFYENAILNLEENYKSSKLNGARVFYHQNGAVWFKENYVNGVLQGERACYFPSGELQMKENYEQGLLNGEKKIFDKDGTIVFEEQYTWGNPAGKRKK